ncbi:Putative amidase domain-containing protein [Ruminococcus sp. YE71]|uniref:amidase domain-containing protein n=1 Tax=unclassified Ruminococcus TaxID=2608920 RepID=UPI0008823719|nr:MULTISPECIES: amidase domain-containing protein [unclassified Ruminococcus]SDA30644.1 Putative amidase domain-containing protein [Ruminococcus sp. YE78]SFW49986.1 Putative amidase domain-containing protein [Ruminococcus sp. YE71]
MIDGEGIAYVGNILHYVMTEYLLDRSAEVAYARRWAFSHAPAFYDFEELGGDCTNFVSQCLYAGGAVMNLTRDTGWYYLSLRDRAAAWTGVGYFYRFIVGNKGVGPFGHTVPPDEAEVGDVIQLSTNGIFHHSLLVVDVRGGVPFVAAHSSAAFNRPLTTYRYGGIRCLRITGARK